MMLSSSGVRWAAKIASFPLSPTHEEPYNYSSRVLSWFASLNFRFNREDIF